MHEANKDFENSELGHFYPPRFAREAEPNFVNGSGENMKESERSERRSYERKCRLFKLFNASGHYSEWLILKKGTATVEIVEEISGAYIGQLTAIEGLSWDNFDLKINDFVLIRPSKKHVTLANDPKIILMIEKEDIMARKIGPRNLILDL